jgi:transcriptional antiterminator RfaH
MDMNALQGMGITAGQHAAWYLVHCKPRQDERAEEHLARQGYACFRPRLQRERLLRGRRQTVVESLFPGYLFIQLHIDDNWAPLRSTRGVNRLVGFGGYPLQVPCGLIDSLQQRTITEPQPLLQPGDRVRIVEGSFAELDAIFLNMDGEERVVLLMNLLNREQKLTLPLASVRKS